MNDSLKEKKTNIESIIKLHGENIGNVIKSFVNNGNLQDIQQEVYIKIWKNLPKIQNTEKLGGWIRKITVNACKDHLKSKQFKQDNLTEIDDENIINIADRRQSLDTRLVNAERQKKIINAIENLKPKFREVIILYDMKEMSYEEISAKINCPVGTVKSRLFNARKQLQAELADLLN